MKNLRLLCRNILILSIIGGAILSAEGLASMKALCDSGRGPKMTLYNFSPEPGWKVSFRIKNGWGNVVPSDITTSANTNYAITYYGTHINGIRDNYRIEGRVTVTDPTTGKVQTWADFENKPGTGTECPDFIKKSEICTAAVAYGRAPGGKIIGGDIAIGDFKSYQDAKDKNLKCWTP